MSRVGLIAIALATAVLIAVGITINSPFLYTMAFGIHIGLFFIRYRGASPMFIVAVSIIVFPFIQVVVGSLLFGRTLEASLISALSNILGVTVVSIIYIPTVHKTSF